MPTLPKSQERARRALARAEKSAHAVRLRARECQIAAEALIKKALAAQERFAPLVDDPDPVKRREARIAYLRAVQTLARARQVEAMAHEQIGREG